MISSALLPIVCIINCIEFIGSKLSQVSDFQQLQHIKLTEMSSHFVNSEDITNAMNVQVLVFSSLHNKSSVCSQIILFHSYY